MKVAIVLLALVAAASADAYSKSYSGGYGKQHVDYSHVPYYSFDWQVQDEYYNDYGQKETRSKDNTETKWGVALPGKSHIKRDDLINAEMHVSKSYGGHSYGADSYKSNDYKSNDYKPTADYKPKDYKPIDYKPKDYKPIDYKPNEYKSNEYKSNEYKSDDYKEY